MLLKYYDQHTHSSFSEDSEEDIEEYFKLAQEQGIEYVCTCEHFDYNTVVTGSNWCADYNKVLEKFSELKSKYPNVKALLGIEAGYKLSSLKPVQDELKKYDFDIVQFSVHDNDLYDYYFKEAFIGRIDSAMIGYFTHMIEGLYRFTDFDVLSHIDFGFKTVKMIEHSKEFSEYEKYIKEVMRRVIELDKAFEINTKVIETIYDIDHDYHHLDYVLDLYKKMGGKKITISSDAHKRSRYRSSFDVIIPIIKAHGFNELSYFIKREEYKYVID